MEFVRFADIKPTWDIVEFDEGISGIPSVSKSHNRQNPLDKSVALLFKQGRENVYFLPKTGKVLATEAYAL